MWGYMVRWREVPSRLGLEQGEKAASVPIAAVSKQLYCTVCGRVFVCVFVGCVCRCETCVVIVWLICTR